MSELMIAEQGMTPREQVAIVKAQMEAIQLLLKDVLKEGIQNDFAAIPGTGDKKTLLKPGAEKICALLGMSPEPTVEAIEDGDDITYRVTVRMTSRRTGTYLGSGVGEASTLESKYAWREAMCQEEYDSAESHLRRIHWKQEWMQDPATGRKGKKPIQVLQVREYPNDKKNTVLKMAKKRGLLDAVLTVTGASDLFTQEMEENFDGSQVPEDAVSGTQQSQSSTPPVQPKPIITEKQAGRFWAIWKDKRKRDEIKQYLINVCGVEDDRKMPAEFYDEACRWAGSGEPVPAKKAANPAPRPSSSTPPVDSLEKKLTDLFAIHGTEVNLQSTLRKDYEGKLPELVKHLENNLPQ